MEEMIDIELNLGKELANKIHKMTKNELINIIVVESLRRQVQDETIISLEAENLVSITKLNKTEAYVEQGRAMIKAVMERWYEYDA